MPTKWQNAICDATAGERAQTYEVIKKARIGAGTGAGAGIGTHDTTPGRE